MQDAEDLLIEELWCVVSMPACGQRMIWIGRQKASRFRLLGMYIRLWDRESAK